MRLRLVLASQSPRRRQLLEEAGFRFRTVTPDVDESYPADLPMDEIAEYIARAKAAAARPLAEADEIIVAADSIVRVAGQIFGKPADEAEAIRMLRMLSGRSHLVQTGVCLLSGTRQVSFTDTTRVHMDPLSDSEIRYYVSNYHPFDKAGAYGIQEWIGHCKVSRIEGSYLNVMGLPVHRVYDVLCKLKMRN